MQADIICEVTEFDSFSVPLTTLDQGNEKHDFPGCLEHNEFRSECAVKQGMIFMSHINLGVFKIMSN